MKRFLLLVAALTIAAPAAAQAPNRSDVVRALASSGQGALLMQGCKTSKEACGQFTRLVACQLAGDGFGLLTKQPGQNQYDGYAVDAIAYKSGSLVQVVDIISQNESANAAPSWAEVPRRDGNNWHEAAGCGIQDPGSGEPPPPPPPPSSSAATAALQQQQIALLQKLVDAQAAQIDEQRHQSAALESAIRDLKAEIAKGIKVRF